MIGELIDTMANIEYGILIAIVLDAAMLFLLAASCAKKELNTLSYIIAVVLLVPLSFQMSWMISACEISRATSTLNSIVGAVSPTLSKYVQSATSHEIGWFIFRRVLWSVVFMAVGGVGIYITMDNKKRGGHRPPSGFRTERRYSSNTSSHHRRR